MAPCDGPRSLERCVRAEVTPNVEGIGHRDAPSSEVGEVAEDVRGVSRVTLRFAWASGDI